MPNYLFRYQLVRYVADLRRLEPQNIGVVVQTGAGIRSRFNSRFRGKANFDSENFRAWRAFFDQEIHGQAVPIFQPKKTSLDFLLYLQSKCRGNYTMTNPAEIVMTTADIEGVLDYLYETLVKPPTEKSHEASQPVKKFKDLLHSLGSEAAFLKRNEPLYLPDGASQLVQYQYLRNHGSDTRVIVQAIQWFKNDPQRTKGTIENALRVAELVDKNRIKAELSVVADNIVEIKDKKNQTSAWLSDFYLKALGEMEHNTNRIVRDTESAGELASSIQKDLKDLEASEMAKKESGDLLAVE